MQSPLKTAWFNDSPLSIPNYRNLWIGQSISTFGERFTTIALPILVFELTGEVWQLGFAFFLQVLASVTFGLWAGALTDRWDRRRTMIYTEIARAGLILCIPLVLYLELSTNVKLGLVYLISFAVAAGERFFRPAKIGIIPELVPKDKFMDANAWDQGATNFTQFLGYTAAGFFIALTSTATAFIVDAVTFLVSAFFLSRIVLTKRETEEKDSAEKPAILDSIREGLDVAWNIPLVRIVLILGFMAPIAFGGLQPLLLVFSERVLESGTIGFGLISGSMALGGAIGYFLINRMMKDQFRGYLLSYGILFLGGFQLLGVLLPVFAKPRLIDETLVVGGLSLDSSMVLLAIALPFFLLTTVANSAITLGIRTIVQESTPRQMIGRVFSVVGVGGSVAIALGSTTVGLADQFGVASLMIFWAVFLIVIGLAAAVHPALQPPKAIETTVSAD